MPNLQNARLRLALTAVLAIFVLAGGVILAVRQLQRPPAGTDAALPLASGTKVIVCYFYGKDRCPVCASIESYAKEALETGFAAELQSGRLEWRSVNYEQPGNEHFAADYKLVAPGLVLVAVEDGETADWKSLPEVWMHVGDRPATLQCVSQSVREFLDSQATTFPAGPAVTGFLAAVALALVLGVQTSISPCPLATNVAAISYVGRRVGRPRQVLLAGVLYTLGRTLVYLALGTALVAGLLSVPGLSMFLQTYINQLLGPTLIVVAVFLLGLVRVNVPGPGVGERLQQRVDALGIWGAGLLGVLFALAFCPISAAWFFGVLIPLAVKVRSGVMLPVAYGLGTALPVIVFAGLIALGAGSAGKWLHAVSAIECRARRIAGAVFLLVGIFYVLRFLFGVL